MNKERDPHPAVRARDRPIAVDLYDNEQNDARDVDDPPDQAHRRGLEQTEGEGRDQSDQDRRDLLVEVHRVIEDNSAVALGQHGIQDRQPDDDKRQHGNEHPVVKQLEESIRAGLPQDLTFH